MCQWSDLSDGSKSAFDDLTAAAMAGAGQRHGGPGMKAAVYTRYGPAEVIEIKDITKPVPADHEVLIFRC